jgi:hypothetical protein
MTRLNQLLIILILSICCASIQLKANDKRSYHTNKINQPAPHIDGIINEPVWDIVEWEGDFVQFQPYENRKPSEETRFKIIYDDNNLYIAIRAFDSSPDSIEKRMSRRDGFEGDWVGVSIDSYHDLLTGFSFTITAAGVKGDEAITNDGNWDATWDPIWYVKTAIDDQGWTAEMQIPLTQLRFGKKDEYVWGLQVSRKIFRHDERSSWQFISQNASGYVHNFGELTGIKQIVPHKQKDITPYILGKFEKYQPQEGNPYAGGSDLSAAIGVDGKIGLTNDLTLDFTLNPDFGQVEADPSEVNLTTFETYFSEKRTFFIEGRNILSHQVLGGGSPLSSDNLFYTRRIGKQPSYSPEVDADNNEYLKMPQNTTILGAFKVTGKTPEGYSIGILESVTQEEKANLYLNGRDTTEVVEPLTNYFVGRVARDFNNSNTNVGVMLTGTNRNITTDLMSDRLPKSAYTGGINFNHNWKDKTYYLNFNAVFSQVNGTKTQIYSKQTDAPHFFQRPDADYVKADSGRTSLEGWGGTIQAGKAGNGKLMYTSWLTWRSPGLNLNDVGYMNRNDEIMEVFWVGYYQNEPFSIFRSASINFNQWYGLTFGLDKRYFGGNLNGHVQYKNYWCTGLGISRDMKSLSTEALRGGPALIYAGQTDYWGHIGTDNRKKVRMVVMYSGGIRDGHSAAYNNYSLSLALQVSNAFKLSLDPSIYTNKDEIAYIDNNFDYSEPRYIRGTIDQTQTSLTIRFTYNITPDFTIQYYAMPFISAGSYSRFQYVKNPVEGEHASEFTAIDENSVTRIYDEEGIVTEYQIDENNDNTMDYKFGNPDFSVMDFNSNLVIRWEYLPGSTLYVVWTQNRNNYNNTGSYSFTDNINDLFINTYPHDVFLVKLSYRLGL